MRITLFIVLICFSNLFCRADEGLKNIIAKCDTATTYLSFEKLANETEQITPTNSKNWLFYYWGAYNFAMSGYLAPKIQKDIFLDKADALLIKATLLSPKNSEIYLLQSWIHSSRIAVAPASRAKDYGNKSKEAQSKACEISPNNPRCSFMQAAFLYHTPPAMGGSKAKAKPFFEETLSKFSSFKPKSGSHPNWGLKQAEKYLASYN
jgi:hypothetical protein